MSLMFQTLFFRWNKFWNWLIGINLGRIQLYTITNELIYPPKAELDLIMEQADPLAPWV